MNKIASFICILALFVLVLSSCRKEEFQMEGNTTLSMEIDRLSFDSIESFRVVMSDMVTSGGQSSAISKPKASLLSGISTLDVSNDPILLYDLRNSPQTRADLDSDVYDAVGYDELVPDKNLASLLNARGEISIANTIYKISPSGTYFFDKSLENAFNQHYAMFETMDGTPIDSLTVELENGIYRFATFHQDESYCFTLDETVQSNSYGQKVQNFVNIVSSLQNLDYNRYPRYCSDAQTWLGNIIQSIVGRNKSFDYDFSKKERFTSKFYYYDYLFWESIGAETKMQNKALIGWKKVPASEIYIGWGDIVLETELKGNILEYPTKLKSLVIKDLVYNKYSGKQEDVAYVFGVYLTQEELDKALGWGVKQVLSTIKSKTGTDVSSANKIFLAGPKKYYTIIPSDGVSDKNVSLLDHEFLFDPTINISMNLLNLPSTSNGWIQWLFNQVKNTYQMPNVKLVSGEIRTAVKYNGQIGAMSIYKQKK